MPARKTFVRATAVAGIAGLSLAAMATSASAVAPPTFTLDVPATVHAGAAATEFAGHLSAPAGAQDLWVKTDITGIDKDDIELQWFDVTDNTWKVMPETEIAGGVEVTFGDGDADNNNVKGFSVYPGYSADTRFKIAVDDDATAGNIAWTSSLVTGDDGTLVSSDSGTVAVTVDPTFTLDVPTKLITGATATEFDGHLDAPSGAQDIWVKTDITGIDKDDIELQWFDVTDQTWKVMPETEIAGGIQVTYGDGLNGNDVQGFSVPAGYEATSKFRIAVSADAEPGDLAWTSSLVTGNDAAVIGSTSGTVIVDRPVAAVAKLDANRSSVAYGRDITLSGSVTDSNHADAGLEGRAVTVYQQVGNGPVTVFGTATTDENGAFAVTAPAHAGATYWAEVGSVESAKREVAVAKRFSGVKIASKHLTGRQKAVVTGHLATPEARDVVRLQVQRADGTWKSIARNLSKAGSGDFKVRTQPPVGKRVYRLVVSGSPHVTGDVSRTFKVTVVR